MFNGEVEMIKLNLNSIIFGLILLLAGMASLVAAAKKPVDKKRKRIETVFDDYASDSSLEQELRDGGRPAPLCFEYVAEDAPDIGAQSAPGIMSSARL